MKQAVGNYVDVITEIRSQEETARLIRGVDDKREFLDERMPGEGYMKTKKGKHVITDKEVNRDFEEYKKTHQTDIAY